MAPPLARLHHATTGSHRLARWVLLALATLGTACGGVGDLLGRPPPGVDDLPALAEEQAQILGRVNCAACPDRWMPRPCEFLDELRRHPDSLDPLTCAVVAPPATPPGVPERVTPRLEALISAKVEALHDGGPVPVEDALKLYAFGSDVQRLGTIELWLLGQRARAQALSALAEARPDRRWPAELLEFDAAAPAPTRISNVALLELLLTSVEPDWRHRKALADGVDAARAAIRARRDEQGAAMRALRQALSAAWPDGRAPIDLVSVWESAVAVRHRTIEVALTAAVAANESCPESLDALVPASLPSVPEGWTLQPGSCTVAGPALPTPPIADIRTDGAYAAPPR